MGVWEVAAQCTDFDNPYVTSLRDAGHHEITVQFVNLKIDTYIE